MTIKQVVALIRMSRPLILSGGVAAYALGAAMGFARTGAFAWGPAALGLAVTLAANLMAHYADEYADVDTDTLTRRTWFSGGSGALPAGAASPLLALRAAQTLAALTALLCAGGIAAGALPWSAALIVGLGMLGGWVYSMPPLALERRGLGELDNALLGGLLMPLMGYTVQTGAPAWSAVLALAPVVASVMICLLGVHWADRRADAAVGKRSLVVLAGARTRPLHHALTALTYGLALALAGSALPLPVWAAMLLTLPVGLWATLTFGRDDAPLPSVATMVALLLATTAGWIVAGSQRINGGPV